MSSSETVPAPSSKSTVALSPTRPATGRLAVLTAYAVAAATIPIPFVPDRLIVRVRGALAHDVAARHGLTLTADAREVLAAPNSELRTHLARTAEILARQVLRRIRPIGVLTSAVRGIEIYALGMLLERYFTQVRCASTIRVHQEEARRVREVIDRALLRALSPSLRPKTATLNEGAEDLRDDFTRWIDSVLLTSAALPSYLERRIEAAFDEVVLQTPGLQDG